MLVNSGNRQARRSIDREEREANGDEFETKLAEILESKSKQFWARDKAAKTDAEMNNIPEFGNDDRVVIRGLAVAGIQTKLRTCRGQIKRKKNTQAYRAKSLEDILPEKYKGKNHDLGMAVLKQQRNGAFEVCEFRIKEGKAKTETETKEP